MILISWRKENFIVSVLLTFERTSCIIGCQAEHAYLIDPRDTASQCLESALSSIALEFKNKKFAPKK